MVVDVGHILLSHTYYVALGNGKVDKSTNLVQTEKYSKSTEYIANTFFIDIHIFHKIDKIHFLKFCAINRSKCMIFFFLQ